MHVSWKFHRGLGLRHSTFKYIHVSYRSRVMNVSRGTQCRMLSACVLERR